MTTLIESNLMLSFFEEVELNILVYLFLAREPGSMPRFVFTILSITNDMERFFTQFEGIFTLIEYIHTKFNAHNL